MSIPVIQLPPPTPFNDVAESLLRAGWHPFPLPLKLKKEPPTGFTGHAAKIVTLVQVRLWMPEHAGGNVAIRMPAGVLGIDVDDYDDKRGVEQITELEAKYGALPATYGSTSRHGTLSGIWFYRVPVGTRFPSALGTAIEVIQPHHRYAVVSPSIHPNGAVYGWYDPAGEEMDNAPETSDLTDLPWAWVDALSIKTPAGFVGDPVTTERVAEFIDVYTERARPEALKGIQRSLDTRTKGRHDTLVERACQVAREVAAGWYAALDGLALLERWWRRVMDDQRRIDGTEFADALAWGIGQADGDPQRVKEMRRKPKPSRPPPNVDPETGEILLPPSNLPEAFWQARPAHGHIRQAAYHRGRSADGVLGTVLARVAAQIHPSIRLPAIVGASSPLSVNVALIGKAGAGKSSGKDVGGEIAPINFTEVLDDIPLGSGEGMIELFFDNVTEVDPKSGKAVSVKRQTKWGMFAYLDEGQALGAMGGRQGSTLLPTIRTAWSGGVLGQANATLERRRILKKGSYSLCFVVGFQIEHAVGLLDDAAGGTPQRFLFLSSNDPNVPDLAPEWPGELEWKRPAAASMGRWVEIDKALAKQIRAESIAATRSESEIDPLDAHANLVILRVAALLGILDNRLDVNAEDWELAKMIWATSCAVRTDVRRASVELGESKVLGRIRERVRTETAVADSSEERTLRSAARSIANRVHREAEPVSRRELNQAMAGKHKAVISVDDAIGRAIEEGWIKVEASGFTKGKSKPT